MKKLLLVLMLAGCRDDFQDTRMNAIAQRIQDLQDELNRLNECIQRLDLTMRETDIVISLRECTYRSRR